MTEDLDLAAALHGVADETHSLPGHRYAVITTLDESGQVEHAQCRLYWRALHAEPANLTGAFFPASAMGRSTSYTAEIPTPAIGCSTSTTVRASASSKRALFALGQRLMVATHAPKLRRTLPNRKGCVA